MEHITIMTAVNVQMDLINGMPMGMNNLGTAIITPIANPLTAR